MVACNRPCKQRLRVKRRFYGDSDTPACNYLLLIACKMVSCNRPCKQRLRVKRRLHGDSDTPACNYLLRMYTCYVHHGFDNRGKWLNPQRIYGERKIRLPEVVVVVIVVLVMMVIMVEVMVTVVMVTGGEGRQWRKAISEGR